MPKLSGSRKKKHNNANYLQMPRIEYYPPPDKSITVRAILLASFASGKSVIRNPLFCEDTSAAIECSKKLGSVIEIKGNSIEITGGRLHNPEQPLYCGSSGTLARLLCGLISGSGLTAEICGSTQLSSRPMSRITVPLRLMGAEIEGDSLPLRIRPSELHGISYSLPIASATVKSGLLFAGISASGKTSVKEPFQSRNHGENILELFGVPVHRGFLSSETAKSVLKPCEIEVPGDFSSAAFFIAGAHITNCSITIRGTGLNPSRLGMMDVLKNAGADFEFQILSGGLEPHGNIVFHPSELKPLCVGKNLIPSLIDEIPALSVIAASIPGESVFCGIDELKVKESDRISGCIRLVKTMGANAWYDAGDGGSLRVAGRSALKCGGLAESPAPGAFDCIADHRMAMAAAAARLICPGITVSGADCTAKSYPGFAAGFRAAFGKEPWHGPP